MSAREDTTPQALDRSTILKNVHNWRKTHPKHGQTPDEAYEAMLRHERQQRYWIRNGRIVSIAQAMERSVVNGGKVNK